MLHQANKIFHCIGLMWHLIHEQISLSSKCLFDILSCTWCVKVTNTQDDKKRDERRFREAVKLLNLYTNSTYMQCSKLSRHGINSICKYHMCDMNSACDHINSPCDNMKSTCLDMNFTCNFGICYVAFL